MDMFFDLARVGSAVDAYDSIIEQLGDSMRRMDARCKGVAFREWSGEARDAFDTMSLDWSVSMARLLADVKRTRDILAGYALEQGSMLKRQCEQFGDPF